MAEPIGSVEERMLPVAGPSLRTPSRKNVKESIEPKKTMQTKAPREDKSIFPMPDKGGEIIHISTPPKNIPRPVTGTVP